MTTHNRVQRLVPSIWFARTAAEAAQFYVTTFTQAGASDTGVVATSHYPVADLPDFQKEFAGDVLEVRFRIAGVEFSGINAGDQFTPNPSISFMVFIDPDSEDAVTRVDSLFARLADGGGVLMPLGDYPFSPRFGWVADKYGVSWQVMLGTAGTAATESEVGAAAVEGEATPQRSRQGGLTVVPALMFPHKSDQAGEAADLYVDTFQRAFGDASVGQMAYYPPGAGQGEHALMQGFITLAGLNVTMMDSGAPHDFTFDMGVSLLVQCDTQEEIDTVWETLSADPEAEMCGWLKDRYGISWQVTSTKMAQMMERPGAWAVMGAMTKPVLADFEALPSA